MVLVHSYGEVTEKVEQYNSLVSEEIMGRIVVII